MEMARTAEMELLEVTDLLKKLIEEKFQLMVQVDELLNVNARLQIKILNLEGAIYKCGGFN